MAVTSFDSKFSFQQDAVARLGDKANKHSKMSKGDMKDFQKSGFMQMVDKVNTLHKQLSESRDKARAETDPSFEPSDEDFKVERTFKFDKLTNYYKTLGVMEYETQANVRKAYRDLSLIYHPDKTAGLSQEAQEYYRHVFIELKNANTVLSDNVMRRQYDSARDKEIASCEVRGAKMQERKDQFDPRNAEAVMARGGPRCAQAVRSDGKVNSAVPSETVEIALEVHLEQFVFGGQETVTQTLTLVDEESRDLGILEFEEQDRDFEVQIPPGTAEPFTADFPGQGNQHEAAPPDNIKFLITSKPHATVERSGADLWLKGEVPTGPGPYIVAETPIVRGRHAAMWALNPFFRDGETTPARVQVRLQGAGVGSEGAFCFTCHVAAPTSAASTGPLQEAPVALQQRLARRQDQRQQTPCDISLFPLGNEVMLQTQPPCTLQAFANLWEGAAGLWGVEPYTVFAIVLSSTEASAEEADEDWRRLRSSVMPLLQLSGFRLFAAARAILPRALANVAALSEEELTRLQAVGPRPDEPGASWRQRGNDAFGRGDYWTAVSCYTRELDELPESGEEQRAAKLLSNRSACLHKLNDNTSALADARRAVELQPGWTRAWTRVSTAAASLGGEAGLEEATAARAKMVELEPTSSSAEALCAFLGQLLRPSEAAAREAKARGTTAWRAKEWAKAVAECTVGAARLDPQDRAQSALRCELLCDRSRAFAQLLDWGAAVGDAWRALEAKPQSVRARCLLGAALLGMRETEQAYGAFAEAVKKDHESEAARKGRDACLTEMVFGRSARAEARKAWRMIDAHRPKSSTRVFAISDIHLDHSQRQHLWLAQIDLSKFKDDVIIVAGNLAIKMPSIIAGLTLLKSKFRRVFYTIGNDEMRIVGHESPDSIAKMQGIFAACDAIEVDVCPAAVSEELFIVPLLSWYNAEFDWTDPRPDPELNVDSMCRWPIDSNEQVWKYMMKMNEQYAQTELHDYVERKTVMTFSHFLPRRDLPFHYMTDMGMKAAKFLGCEAIDHQLRMINSKLHVYGHSHFLHAEEHDGVFYVQQPLGYPQERLMIHRDEERALLMQVHNGEEPCMLPWNSVTDEAAEQEEMRYD